MKQATKAQQQKVLAAVRSQFNCDLADTTDEEMGFASQDGPKLVSDFDWLGHGAAPAIVWEEGPHEWSYAFPFGGIDPEFGFKIKSVEKQMPAGIFSEAITSWAIGIVRT